MRRIASAALMLLLAAAPGLATDWDDAIAALHSGDLDAARSGFEAVIEQHPEHASAYIMLGRTLSIQGETAGAIRALNHALSLDPDNANTTLVLASTLVKANRADDAIDCLASLDPAGLDPQSTRYRALLAAQIARDATDPARVVDIVREAVAAAPGDADLQKALAATLDAAGDDHGSFTAWAAAARLEPTDVDSAARAVRSGITWANGIDDAASATLAWDEVADQAQIIAEAVDDPDIWHLTGICCKSARRWDDAEEAFTHALEARPDDPEDLYLSASVMRCLNRDRDAESRFTEALEHAPDASLARRIHANLAALAEKRLDLDEAVVHHRAAEQLKRATEIEALAASFREALASRLEIDRQLAELETMVRQLTELGENEGAEGIQRQIDRIIVDRNALDANLSEVRKALKADDTSCG